MVLRGGNNLILVLWSYTVQNPCKITDLPWISYQNQWFSIDFFVRTCQFVADTVTAGQVRPKLSDGKLLRKNSAFKYGAFGAKRSLLSSRFFCATFSKKLIFLGVPESELEFGKC